MSLVKRQLPLALAEKEHVQLFLYTRGLVSA